jgi:hypothetical protein
MARTIDVTKVANLAKAVREVAGDINVSEELPYVSRMKVIESDVLDPKPYEGAYAAKAALSQHLNLATSQMRNDPTLQIRQELEPFVEMLKNIRLPDTRVNLGTQKIDMPWDITDYANKISQPNAVSLLYTLLGKESSQAIYKYSRLAGQEYKPTLWLVHKLYVESKQKYVHTIRHSDELKSLVSEVDLTKLELMSEAVKEILGGVMYSELDTIARGNDMSPFVIFVILLHNILQAEEKKRVPMKITSTWDSLAEELEL